MTENEQVHSATNEWSTTVDTNKSKQLLVSIVKIIQS